MLAATEYRSSNHRPGHLPLLSSQRAHRQWTSSSALFVAFRVLADAEEEKYSADAVTTLTTRATNLLIFESNQFSTNSSITTTRYSGTILVCPRHKLQGGDTTTIASLTWTILRLQTILYNKILRSASLELHNISNFRDRKDPLLKLWPAPKPQRLPSPFLSLAMAIRDQLHISASLDL